MTDQLIVSAQAPVLNKESVRAREMIAVCRADRPAAAPGDIIA
jgi:hypothetical protein